MGAALHRAPGGMEFSISRSEPCRIEGSGGADFVLRAHAIQIERQAALQGFDLELRVITQRSGRFCAQSREFTHSDTLCLAKFDKLMVEPRGTTFAEVISAERRSKQGYWSLNAPRCAKME